jgi:uncharacterized membrane protein
MLGNLSLKDIKRGCLRWRAKEGWLHVLKKLEVCYWLSQNGYVWVTEAEFTTGGRADIVVLKPMQFIIEVVNTEKEVSIVRKKGMYPMNDIRVVRTDVPFDPKMIQ